MLIVSITGIDRSELQVQGIISFCLILRMILAVNTFHSKQSVCSNYLHHPLPLALSTRGMTHSQKQRAMEKHTNLYGITNFHRRHPLTKNVPTFYFATGAHQYTVHKAGCFSGQPTLMQ